VSGFIARGREKRRWRFEHCHHCGTHIGSGETEWGYRVCSDECAEPVHESKIM
jgi:predicted nucleic acid-binding Zn ribbon protein